MFMVFHISGLPRQINLITNLVYRPVGPQAGGLMSLTCDTIASEVLNRVSRARLVP